MLSSRYKSREIQEGVLRSAQILSRAQAEGAHQTPALWKAVAIGLPLLAIAVIASKDRAAASAQNRLAFDRSRVVSADLAGLRASTDELVNEPPNPPPAPEEDRRELARSVGLLPPSPTPPPRVRHSGLAREILADDSREPAKRCDGCELAKLSIQDATETLYDASFGMEIPAAEEQRKMRIPLGTRIPAVLLQPVTTAAEGAPVTAEVRADVTVAGAVAISSGSRLEGLAFATDADDRARILVTAVVTGNQTIPLQAVVLDGGNELGLLGKVISKGSRRKHGSGLVLRALGSAAAYGFGGTAGVAGAALSQLGGGVSQDLQNLTRDWMVSDKGVRVPGGTEMVVYLRSEAVMP
jgi:hypothetical protein